VSNPLYDELADRRGIDVPENPDWFTSLTPQPTVSGVSRAAGVQYAGYSDYPAAPEAPQLVDVPPRVDDWCENRAPDQLTDHDGVD
jgi:hypothetical protein